MRSLVALGLAFLPTFFFASELYDLLATPLMRALPEGSKMIATGVITPFFVPMKIALMVAFLIALPYVLYQAWAFVAPGLYAHEKKLVAAARGLEHGAVPRSAWRSATSSSSQTVFTFIAQFAPKSITVAPDIEAYFNFVLSMFVAFGVTFEMPVVVVVLVLTGIVSVEKLKRDPLPT